ncbi:MAG: deoxyhypusine synthase [Thermofilum sp. ex4484_79]|nr:MAG: deoxyhypusine synthase [Thermofilum sp. ex4484_79]
MDIVITTGGSIDHDIARTYTSYYRGAFEVDDRELQRRGIHRLGNVFIPIQNYGPLIEEFTKNFLRMLRESGVVNPSASELIYHLGLAIGDENSFLYQAAKSKIPVFSPGILDSSFGTNFSLYSKDYGIRLDLVKDMNKLLSLSFDINKSGAIILGGGISKHHTIWWNQFKGGLDYAIYITTAVEWDGSLSGARTREAISWGKINTKARHVTVEGDVTVIFPILMVGLNELNIKRNGKNLCDILGIS